LNTLGKKLNTPRGRERYFQKKGIQQKKREALRGRTQASKEQREAAFLAKEGTSPAARVVRSKEGRRSSKERKSEKLTRGSERLKGERPSYWARKGAERANWMELHLQEKRQGKGNEKKKGEGDQKKGG